MATRYDMHLIRGDTFSLRVRMEYNDGAAIVPDEFDSIRLTVCPDGFGHDKIELELGADIIVSDGSIIVTLRPEVTRDAEWDNASYDMRTIRGNIVKTVLRGNIFLARDCTL